MLDYASNIGDFRKNKHLSPIERGQIAALHAQGYTPYRIGKLLGRASNTIRNELKRGSTISVDKGNYKKIRYFPERGQIAYENNRKRCRQDYKAFKCEKFIKYVESKVLEDKRSLDSIYGRVLKQGYFKKEEVVCTKTLYNYVEAGVIKVKNIDLPEKVKRRTKKKTYSKRYKRTDGRSIEERAEQINNREEFGHWEIDLVIGKKDKEDNVLLTLTERKTRKEIIRKIEAKTIEAVQECLDQIVKEVPREALKSITSDNGQEFARLYNIEEKGIKVYYAHPYSSYERGQNENTNGIIRRFIPKGMEIKKFSDEKIKKIEKWINTMPRRNLGYSTAEELYQEEVENLEICA